MKYKKMRGNIEITEIKYLINDKEWYNSKIKIGYEVIRIYTNYGRTTKYYIDDDGILNEFGDGLKLLEIRRITTEEWEDIKKGNIDKYLKKIYKVEEP